MGAEKDITLIVSLIGFLLFDMVYVAAVMNYAIQSELNISLLHSVYSKVKDKDYQTTNDDLDIAIKVRA